MKKNGLRFLALLPLLALFGCESSNGEVTAFGLSMQYSTADGQRGSSCSLGGDAFDGDSLRVDHTDALPDLFVETDADRVNDTIAVRVVEVTAYEPNSKVPASKKILEQRTYDKQFGEKAAEDEFHVESEGMGYDIQIKGLPIETRECPKFATDPGTQS
jgi:hypothetical protein